MSDVKSIKDELEEEVSPVFTLMIFLQILIVFALLIGCLYPAIGGAIILFITFLSFRILFNGLNRIVGIVEEKK